ncbi:hypothetical protein OK016_21540 [Vibrio chagasii]|nr:hypothetical protein [Vibrio chagasii]
MYRAVPVPRKTNCDLIQGYLFSQPLTYTEFIEFIRGSQAEYLPRAMFDA